MKLNVNEKFLSKMKEEKQPVDIYLSNKVMLTGKIIDFDDICLLLDTMCLVYYSNIISIKIAEKK
jgi:RNA chaperone Hfq